MENQKLNIERKISGWQITNFKIEPVCCELLGIKKAKTLKAWEWLEKTYNFPEVKNDKGETEGKYAWLEHDDIYKIAIMENYPEYEKQLTEYFGKEWLRYYLRFDH